MMHRRIERVMSGASHHPVARLMRLGLGVVEPVYREVVRRRNAAFDGGRRSVADLGRPVVSVGNLTTGGTGKTPMVVALARWLVAAGHRPAVLLRGYRGEKDAGLDGGPRRMDSDEAREYLAALPGVPVAADPDRERSAAWVLRRRPEVDVFLLDDGFQRRQVRRDVDLVLIDATNPFGFGHLLPRGLLREPVAGLRRADGVIITRGGRVKEPELVAIERRVAEVAGDIPVARAESVWTGLMTGEGERAVSWLEGRRVYAAAGIGNPWPFLAMAHEASEVVGEAVFDDHHVYGAGDVGRMAAEARACGAEVVLTTEKDWVKLGERAEGLGLPVVRPVLATRMVRGGEVIESLIGRVLS
ncbi:tetraacyldisaccharide 4'-kinase [Mucisphaera calidilacus]|uniref:Tetraacyldisaccharide 4'-kinase n=1 Tax=Mucisphaera calidilacus TaxID=2527982 RepID=A0A518BTC9_9BACT|nr:tetraacyldisaccharide 4'-kinase [Mucisphaera calidilacus]QDU70231.1 Tetraacyldisaccharide 4'-kinase [Mucisphaera calidilacus]